MRRSFTDTSTVQREGKPRHAHIMQVPIHHRRCESAVNPRWQDVSAISLTTCTNDESIAEVLEGLKPVTRGSPFDRKRKEMPCDSHEVQFEALARGSSRKGYYRVLHLI